VALTAKVLLPSQVQHLIQEECRQAQLPVRFRHEKANLPIMAGRLHPELKERDSHEAVLDQIHRSDGQYLAVIQAVKPLLHHLRVIEILFQDLNVFVTRVPEQVEKKIPVPLVNQPHQDFLFIQEEILRIKKMLGMGQIIIGLQGRPSWVRGVINVSGESPWSNFSFRGSGIPDGCSGPPLQRYECNEKNNHKPQGLCCRWGVRALLLKVKFNYSF
jgi:hypothetical protein